jgi:hypothetical protein
VLQAALSGKSVVATWALTVAPETGLPVGLTTLIDIIPSGRVTAGANVAGRVPGTVATAGDVASSTEQLPAPTE